MEISVKHTVSFDAPTLSALVAVLGGKATTPAAPASTAKPATETKATEKPASTTKAATEKPKGDDFASLDEDGQLEAIKAEVTKHTKKGKSADIKALLTFFGAARASELEAGKYGEFMAAIKRYGAGETIEAITGGDDDLS